METSNYITIECTYPHGIMMHMRKVLQGELRVLEDQPTFFSLYCQAYPEDGQEIFLLETAYRHGIIDGFFEKSEQPVWEKRVFLETSLRRLVRYISERDAVMLLESLMFQFRWDISMQVKRQWKTPPEEQADFHGKMGLSGQAMPDILGDAGKNTQEHTKPASDMPAASADAGGRVLPVNEGESKSIGKQAVREKISYFSDSESVRQGPEQMQFVEYSGEDIEPEDITLHIQTPEQAKFYPQMNQRIRKVLRKAINGDVASQCGMGDYYAEDDSGHKDYMEALRWYKLAAYHGNDRAIFEMGKLYSMRSSDIPYTQGEALRWFRNLAERGFPTAQCILGMKYWLGDGVENSLPEAVKWLEQAAKQRHETAIRHLGDLYASAEDTKNAVKWYQIGAGYGDTYCIGKLTKTL